MVEARRRILWVGKSVIDWLLKKRKGEIPAKAVVKTVISAVI